MQKYVSHKVVEAAEIVDADPVTNMLVVVEVGGGPVEHVTTPPNFFARGIPNPGDYVVRYADGYLSWSPKAAFEDGYTPLLG